MNTNDYLCYFLCLKIRVNNSNNENLFSMLKIRLSSSEQKDKIVTETTSLNSKCNSKDLLLVSTQSIGVMNI